MDRLNIRYIGALGDTSGYASAARSYVKSLHETGQVNLTTSAVSFEQEHTTHGQYNKLIQELNNKPIDFKIQITHLTPENFPGLRTQGRYNIGYTTWETDKLPHGWKDLCNVMDEIWVPSEWNKKVFESSGVIRPIIVIPHVIEVPDTTNIKPLELSNVESDVFTFYSIFQWIERKNPVGLLKAYFTEFQNGEKVALALKSYRLNTSPSEQETIRGDIKKIKQSLNLKNYPPILFFGKLMPADQMASLHKAGNCFVLAHRAEGFGIPHAEAMSYGNPVIASGYGGNLDFMNKDNSFLIDTKETPVAGMVFSNYHGLMTWGDPDLMHLRKHMRFVYENRQAAKQIGLAGLETIKTKLSSQVIGNLMVNRLKEIDGSK